MRKTWNKRYDDVIVWDVDETLGSFATFSDIYSAVSNASPHQFAYEDFKALLDMFPEYIRPKLFKYLRYLKKFKNKNDFKVIIYTNNNGGSLWIDYIKQYIEEKIHSAIFDDVIMSYDSDSRRTTYNKTYGDLQRCLNTKALRHVCFIDDQEHYIKNDRRVNYLHIPPYVKYPNAMDVGSRLLNSKMHIKHIKNFPIFIKSLKNNLDGPRHLNDQVQYSELDDKVMENFVHKFIRQMHKKRNRTCKIN